MLHHVFHLDLVGNYLKLSLTECKVTMRWDVAKAHTFLTAVES